MATNFKEPRIRDKAHLKFLRSLICVNCGVSKPLEAAHIRAKSVSGLGIKPSDSRCVPLCTKCHFQQHNGLGESFFWGEVLDAAIGLSASLYESKGDRSKCMGIIHTFLGMRKG